MKTCSKCKTDLPLDSFNKKGDRLRSECKECKKEARLAFMATLPEDELAERREKARRQKRARAYGMHEKDLQYVEAVKFCAICHGKAEVIDHCHETGRVRGVLCNACNTSLGKMHDSPAFLRRAAEYLEEHGEPQLYGH